MSKPSTAEMSVYKFLARKLTEQLRTMPDSPARVRVARQLDHVLDLIEGDMCCPTLTCWLLADSN